MTRKAGDIKGNISVIDYLELIIWGTLDAIQPLWSKRQDSHQNLSRLKGVNMDLVEKKKGNKENRP